MDKFKLRKFTSPELVQAFEELLKASEKMRQKEIELRLSVYRLYVFEGYINLN